MSCNTHYINYIAEDDLEELQANHSAALRESQETYERKYERQYIADIAKRLEATNKSLRVASLWLYEIKAPPSSGHRLAPCRLQLQTDWALGLLQHVKRRWRVRIGLPCALLQAALPRAQTSGSRLAWALLRAARPCAQVRGYHAGSNKKRVNVLLL
jgi:hypothetical protein